MIHDTQMFELSRKQQFEMAKIMLVRYHYTERL